MRDLPDTLASNIWQLIDNTMNINAVNEATLSIIERAQQLEQMGHLLNFLYISYQSILNRKTDNLMLFAKNIAPDLRSHSIHTIFDCHNNMIFAHSAPTQTMISEYVRAINVLTFLHSKENIVKLCAIIFGSETEKNQQDSYFSLLTRAAGNNMFRQGFVLGEDATTIFRTLIEFNENMNSEHFSITPKTLLELDENILSLMNDPFSLN
jgi:hypothetical protein